MAAWYMPHENTLYDSVCMLMPTHGQFLTRTGDTTSRTPSKKKKKRKYVFSFQRLKNREDSSNFDDFWTKIIAATQPIS